MTNNQLTGKRLAQLAKRNFCQTKGEEYKPFGDEVVSMAAELQERRKADSEPVARNYRKLFTCTGCGAEGLDEPLETNCHCCVDGAHWVESRLYRHAQPAPVVDADDNFYSWFGREWHENYQHNQYTTAAKQMLGVMAESAWKAGHRAAMLQVNSGGDDGPTDDERVRYLAWDGVKVVSRYRHAQPVPVVPDGYVMVPKEPTAEMVNKMRYHVGGYDRNIKEGYKAMLAAAPQEVKGE